MTLLSELMTNGWWSQRYKAIQMKWNQGLGLWEANHEAG